MEFHGWPEKLRRDRFATASVAAIALVCAVILATFRDYPYSWDEMGANYHRGLSIIRFYLSLGSDLSGLEKHDFSLYGGAFDLVVEIFTAISPFDPRNSRHFANACAGLAALAGAYRLARDEFGTKAAFWTILFLALCPPFYGHIFINSRDIPFAAGYVWSLALLLRLPRAPTLRNHLLLGLAMGFTAGVRVGGLMLLFYLGAFWLHARWVQARGGSKDTKAWPSSPGLIAATCALAYAVMLAVWPSALLSPIAHPFRALLAFGKYTISEEILWSGRTVLSTRLPWDYLPRLFAVELPEVAALVLIPALASVGFCAAGARTGAAGFSSEKALLLFAALFPPLWAIATNATLYDNTRHFLFVLPLFAVCCGHFAAASHGWLNARFSRLGDVAAGALAVGLLTAGMQMARLHPYEYVYKNAFAGGMPAASASYETDYWLTSYREAFAVVREHAARAARGLGRDFATVNFSVAVVGEPGLAEEELPPNMTAYFLVRESDARADYLVAPTRYGADKLWPEYMEIGRVEKLGMTFSVVKTSPRLAGAARESKNR